GEGVGGGGGGGGGREEVRPGEALAGRARPEVGERGLGGRGEGTRALDHAVPPVLLRVRVAQPFVADRDPAREADRAVDHDRAPVVALVAARELAEPRGA